MKLAEESLRQIMEAKTSLQDQDYLELYHYFSRTLLTARLHRATASAYFGFRIYGRGEGFRTRDGWPRETGGIENPAGGLTFPIEVR